jgi:transcriptional regulator with XRE-family HTH domain
MPELKGASRDDDAICFGRIVRRLRMQRGWTLAQLAHVSGMHPTYLGVMERGGNAPSVRSLITLAQVFGVDPGALIREIVDTREQFKRQPQPE